MTPAQPIDLLDPATFAHGHPHDQYRWLRENDPVHFHEEKDGPGFWALTRYRDVREVGRNPTTFSSSPTIMISGEGLDLGDHQMMLMMDPPLHSRYRRLMIPDFVPRAVAGMAGRVDELAHRIIDAVCERGECDLVEDIAGEMPSFVWAALLHGRPPRAHRGRRDAARTSYPHPGYRAGRSDRVASVDVHQRSTAAPDQVRAVCCKLTAPMLYEAEAAPFFSSR